MAYSSPATVVTGTTITSTWGNSVKSATDYLANPPACRAYRSTGSGGFVLPTAVEAAIPFDSERFDTDNMHSTVTNRSRITFNTAGLYQVTACVEFQANATGERMASILKNGTTNIARDRNIANTSGGKTMITLT